MIEQLSGGPADGVVVPHFDDVRAVWVAGDVVHLDNVCPVGDGGHVHLDVVLSRVFRLGFRAVAIHVRSAVSDDDRDVLHAAAVSSSRREDVVVGPVDRLLRVGLSAGGPEAERVQDLLFALVLVQVELDLCVGRETDERDSGAAILER